MFYTQAMDRIINLGLPREVVIPILRKIQDWTRSNGPEWTVERLKDLKLLFISFLSGKPYQPVQWLSLDEKGIPKGCFRPIFVMSPSRKIFNLLLVYTSFVAKEVLPKQKKKFFESMTAVCGVTPHIPNLKRVSEKVSALLPPRKSLSYKDYPWSVTKRAPVHTCEKTVPETIDILWEDFKSNSLWDLLDDPNCERVISESLMDLYPHLLKVQEVNSEERDPVGRISVVQEPGLKARFLANPRRVYQVALRPFGKQLFSVLRQLPWDCTYDQWSGINWVQQQLNSGTEVHSVDLSDATNNFPLNLQLRVLRWIDGLDFSDIILFEKVCRGSWFIPPALRIDPNESQQKWGKGQPLGLYPSFPVFALTHGLLLKSIEETIGTSNSFRVLGDDVVISNNKVYDEYLKLIDLLQIPVSWKKSISSDRVAEFAGVVITASRIHQGVKWRTPTSLNRLALTASLPRAMDLSKPIELLATGLRTIPAPFGTGENPEGLSLQARASLSLPWFLMMDENEGHVTLRRPSEGDYRVSSIPIVDSPVSRKDIDDFTSSVLDKWNLIHPYTQIDVENRDERARKDSYQQPWIEICKLFGFQEVECPNEIVDSGWLNSPSGEKYVLPIILSKIKSDHWNHGWKSMWSREFKNRSRFLNYSDHRQRQYLDWIKRRLLMNCEITHLPRK